MNYRPTVSYANQTRITRVQKRGYDDRAAGKRKKDNPYKNRWDRDNWLVGWVDADIAIHFKADPEYLSHGPIPF